MIRHPRSLELPWDMHWCPAGSQQRHLWWLILLVLLAIVMIGSGAASGFL